MQVKHEFKAQEHASACKHVYQVLVDLLTSKQLIYREGTRMRKRLSLRRKVMVSWRIYGATMVLRALSILGACMH